MSFEWKGVFPALTTQFNANDGLDMDLFDKSLQSKVDAGVHGLIIGGSLGEASALTTAERETLIKFSLKKVNGTIPVVLNIAESSTQEALKQVMFAESWGAEGFMLLPPMRYKSDDNETVQYFKTIANATDLP